MNVALWVLQGLVATFFAMAGGQHLFVSREELGKKFNVILSVPRWFVKFIGVAELLGAVGIVLPMALSILPRLSIAAAVGLALLMGCAVTFNLTRKKQPALELILLLLVVFIAVGRLTLAPA